MVIVCCFFFQTNIFAAYLHDAILLYAHALNKSLNQNVGITAGKNISRSMIGMNFFGKDTQIHIALSRSQMQSYIYKGKSVSVRNNYWGFLFLQLQRVCLFWVMCYSELCVMFHLLVNAHSWRRVIKFTCLVIRASHQLLCNNTFLKKWRKEKQKQKENLNKKGTNNMIQNNQNYKVL